MNRIILIHVYFKQKVISLTVQARLAYQVFKHFFCISLLLMCYADFALASNGVLEDNKRFKVSDYFSRPYVSGDLSQGIILLEIDQSKAMLERAYSSSRFDPKGRDGNVGYFKPDSQYRYNLKRHYFEEYLALEQGQEELWDGRFLNWLLMRQIDMARYFLLGVQEASEPISSDLSNIISLDISLHKIVLFEPKSQSYSPIPNAMPVIIEGGLLKYKNKTLHLRIKNPKFKKGLLGLLTNQVKLYFYAQKNTHKNGREQQAFIFGDAIKLVDYLSTWSANDSGSEQYKSLAKREDQSLKTLQKALEEIKQISLKNVKEGHHAAICQRYVLLTFAESTFNDSFLSNAELLNDCQEKLKGDQTLRNFQLVGSDRIIPSSESKLTFLDADTLFRSIFKVLSRELMADSFQISGADMAYFPDYSGVIYQSMFKYSKHEAKQELNWIGDLTATLIDAQGRLRSDNGDKILGTLSEDPLLSSCFDEKENVLRYRFLTELSAEESCKILNYPYLEEDVGYLWRASDFLNKTSQGSVNRQRSLFKSNHTKRYIRSHIGQTEYDFISGGNDSGAFPVKPEALNVSTQAEADELINYIRGQDQEKFRSRQSGQEIFLLGDTANNSPVTVGEPSSNYHLLYGDHTYQTFLTQYQNRRSRVFLATNDGVLHSFNAGWFDSKTKYLNNSPESGGKWDLGQETWAFVPYAVLPYLSEVSDKYYGISPKHHLNLFGQRPYIFDAKIFDHNGLIGQADQLGRKTHPEGWGTLMLVGVGLAHSAYLVFDITDAEQAPKFLAEIQMESLGSAISLPSLMTLKNHHGELEWKLALGSGTGLDPASIRESTTKRFAGVSFINLKDLQSRGIQTKQVQANLIDLKESTSYVTGISSVDWNLDGETDSLYVNTASHSRKSGAVYRINVRNNFSGQMILDPEKLLDTQATLIDRPQLSLDASDNRWIYLSTGQGMQFGKTLSESFNQRQKHKIIGLKEPRYSQGHFLVDSTKGRSGPIALASLLDVSSILVNPEGGSMSGTWDIQPQLNEDKVSELENRLMQFSDTSSYVDGWVRYLDNHEAATGASKLFGGMLTQAIFYAEEQECRISTDAFVHRLRYTTGTSWFSPDRPLNKTKDMGAELTTTKSNSLGSDVITSVLIHEGDKHVRKIQSSANGHTQAVLDANLKLILSGEISWREL